MRGLLITDIFTVTTAPYRRRRCAAATAAKMAEKPERFERPRDFYDTNAEQSARQPSLNFSRPADIYYEISLKCSLFRRRRLPLMMLQCARRPPGDAARCRTAGLPAAELHAQISSKAAARDSAGY